MKKSIYSIVIAPFVFSLILIFTAWYTVGVVEKNTAAAVAQLNITNLVSDINHDYSEYDSITDQLCREYELKTQTLSILISQMPKTLSEDMTAEELRIVSGADKIMIADKTGLIIFSTSPEAELEYAEEQFRDGLTKKNYCSTSITKSENGIYFDVAVSRRNDNGIIIARFINPAMNEVINFSDSYHAIKNTSVFKSGITAIINLQNGNFTAHTNPTLTGTECVIPLEKFSEPAGNFSYRHHSEPSVVFYQYYDDDTVIINIVSKSEIYTKRTTVFTWLAIIDLLVFISLVLSIRQFNSRQKKSQFI